MTTYTKPPLTREDLVSAGTLGLIKAAHDYDSTKNADFKTYAYIRVKGAVIDEMRKWSFAPSSLGKQLAQVRRLCQEMTEANKGVTPSDEQLAGAMDITVTKLYQIYENARKRHFLSIHGFANQDPAFGESLIPSTSESPESRLERTELIEQLAEAIKSLPDREKELIVLYYQQELTMKEIAMVMEVTESRISQMHSAALFKLSVKLKDYDDSR